MAKRFLPAPDVLTRPQFEAWLQAQDVNSTVGTACSVGDCPLARYLEQCGLGRWVDVHLNKIQVRRIDRVVGYTEDEPRRIPHWAQRFVRRIDRLGRGSAWTPTPIDAATALKALAGIPADKSESTHV